MTEKIRVTLNALRREKSANYTRDEKHLLLDKVTAVLDIIENKKTDTVSVEAKTRAWMRVTTNYNAANPRGTRKSNQLKNLYENLKKRVKRDILTDREEFCRRGMYTSNGKIDDVGWRLMQMLPRLRQLYAAHSKTTNNAAVNQQQQCSILLVHNNNDNNIGIPSYSLNSQTDEVQLNIKEENIIQEATEHLEPPPPEDHTAHFANLVEDQTEIENNEVEMEMVFPLQQQTASTQTDELYEIEKEFKRKEIEKLNLEIQMKQLEVEYMRAKLREQEIHVKFKEMEYQIKYKELLK